MISDAKLLDTVNGAVAELVAEQVYRKIHADLEEKWTDVLSELAHSRKTSERLKEQLEQSQTQLLRIEQVLQQKEMELQQSRATQRKSAEILNEALKSLTGEQ